MDVNAPALVLLNDQALPNTESFTYLGSVVRQNGGTKKIFRADSAKPGTPSRV